MKKALPDQAGPFFPGQSAFIFEIGSLQTPLLLKI
jgi:hypothetical protein